MSEQAALDLWKSFRQYLRLKIEFVDPPELILRLSNTCPTSEEHPVVHFEELRVTAAGATQVDGGPQVRSLPPGTSVELTYTADNPALVRFDVAGSVSRSRFFQTSKAVDAPVELTRPLVAEYLSALQDLSPLDRAEQARTALLGIGTDTTLGELGQIKDRLAASLDALRAVRPCVVPAVGRRVADCVRGYTAPVATSARHAIEALESQDVGSLKQDQDRVRDLVPPTAGYAGVLEEIREEYGLPSG